ncbi:MAG: alpha/beta hydrolase, partial [Rectinema sp.]|nr:alpha/beta hydrolase [Rectinema sp.]
MRKNHIRIAIMIGMLIAGGKHMPLCAQDAKAFLAGTWQGFLAVGPASLRIVFHVNAAEEGFSATMDSPDQNARGIRVTSVQHKGSRVTFSVSSINGEYTGTMNQAGTRIQGERKQAGRTFPLALEKAPEGSKAQSVLRPQEPKPPFSYRTTEVFFENPTVAVTLAGTLSLPSGKGPFPAVVLVSGSGPQDRDEALAGHRPFLVIADYLARRGIASLRYDDRGVGASQGNFAEATTLDLTLDAEAAVAFLKKHPEIDPTRIGMVGHSEGAIIAAIAASRNPQISFIVKLAGPGIKGDQLLLLQNTAIALASGMSPVQIKKTNDINRAVYAMAQEEKPVQE